MTEIEKGDIIAALDEWWAGRRRMTDCNECANFRPKETRAQTGWICSVCATDAPCVDMGKRNGPKDRYKCPRDVSADWRPFYGKVVE